MSASKPHQVQEVLQNQYWLGLAWREAFVVPFFPSSMPAWSDAMGNPINWDTPPKYDGHDGWYVVTSPATDPDGWVYGTSFDRLQYERPGGRASKRAGDGIRSRLWRRAPSKQGKQQHRAVVDDRPGVVTSTKRAVAAIGSSIQQQAGAQKATLGSLWVTVSELLKDAAARHKAHNLAALDITGWVVTIGSHAEVMKKQQLGQLRNLVWFSGDAALMAALKQSPGVEAVGCSGPERAEAGDGLAGPGPGSWQQQRHQQRRQQRQRQQDNVPLLAGKPTQGFLLHIGSASGTGSTIGSGSSGGAASGSSGKGRSSSSRDASASQLELHMWGKDLLQELLDSLRFAQAAYGYVAAAGHLSSAMNVFKLLATLPMFDPITGVSLQANNQALLTLAGLAQEDVVMVEWANTTFRPCHYVALDHAHKRIVLAIRGSLELGDICTDLQAGALDFDFRGVSGKVHQGLMSAATYVHSNTAAALAAAAEAHPGWPLLVTGHSLGGGVAALVTLLLQLPGGSPQGLSHVRCICYGPAAVLSKELAEACKDYIVSVVFGCDPIPRLSQYSVERLLLDLVNASLTRRVTKTLADTTADTLSAISAGISRIASGTSGPYGSPPVGPLPTIELASLLAAGDDGLKLLPRVMAGGSAAGNNDGFDWAALHRHYAEKWFGDEDMASSEPCSPGPPEGKQADWAAMHEDGEQQAAGGPTKTAAKQPIKQQQPSQQQQPPQRQQGVRAPQQALRADDRSSSPASRTAAKLPGKVVAVTSISIKPQTPPLTDADQATTSSHPPTTSQTAAATAFLAAAAAAAAAAASDAADASTSSSPQATPAGSSSARRPGGPKQLTGSSDYAAIFPKVDEELLVSNVQQAYRDITKGSPPPHGAGFPIKLHGAGAAGVSPPPSPSHAAGRRSSMDRLPPAATNAAAPAIAAGAGAPGSGAGDGNAAATGSANAAAVAAARAGPRSEPSFSWAPSSLEPPSWLRVPGFGRGGGPGGSEKAPGEDGGVASLEEDLRHVVHLYPPGRVLWILSDDIMGPAGNQLVQAVEGHLPGAKRKPPPPRSSAEFGSADAAVGSAEADAAELRPPQAGPMEAGTRVRPSKASQSAPGQAAAKHAPVVVTPAAAAQANTMQAAAAQQAGKVLGQATDPKARAAAAEAVDIAQSPTHAAAGAAADAAAGPSKRARLQEPAAGQQQQQQQGPGGAKAGGPGNTAAGQQGLKGQQQGASPTRGFERGSSMEIDGSTAGPASEDYVFVPSQPPELHELMDLLGSPVDAASAISIAHKKALLLEHFRQQRAALAEQEQEQQQQELQERQELQRIHREKSLAQQTPNEAAGQVELADAQQFAASADASATDSTAASSSVSNPPAQEEPSVGGHDAAGGPLSNEAQQQLQLSPLQQSDEFMEWRKQQEELSRQLLERQASNEAANTAGGPENSDKGTAAGLVGGLQGAALESLFELASLPERLTDGLMSLKLNSALCVPGLLGAGAGGSGPSEPEVPRRPVVVEPDAEVFSQLLLHKNAIQDHIPDRYMEALQRLMEWYA